MTPQQKQVAEFMRIVAGQEVHTSPTIRDTKTHALQFSLMREEMIELYVARLDQDRIKTADGLGDLLYVVCNTANAHGVEVKPQPVAFNGEFYLRCYKTACEQGDIDEIPFCLNCLARCVINDAYILNIPLIPVFDEIHRSNMTKLWTNDEAAEGFSKGCVGELINEKTKLGDRCWRVKNSAGKLIKSPSYSPVNLALILEGKGGVK